MILNGREVGFLYSMRAAKMFADFCPERDFSKIGDALSGKYGNMIENQCHFILALNLAFCKSAEHREEGHEPITMDELLDMDQETFQQVFTAAAEALSAGSQTHMETKPAPRKKGSARQENQS